MNGELKYKKINYSHIFFSILSGVLLTLSHPTATFPNGTFSWVAWFAMVPLFFSLKDLSPKDGAKTGLLSGVVYYITLLYWLIHTMNTYGNLPFILCLPVLVLLCFYLSLYTALFSYAIIKICTNAFTLLIVIPFIWVTLEYIRSFLLSGFPWGLLGYSQFNQLYLIQISDLFGVYSVSFLVAFSNSVIFIVLLQLKKLRWQEKIISKKLFVTAVITFICLTGMTLYYGKERIKSIDENIDHALTKKVSVIQANIPQSEKWDPDFQEITVQKYINLSLSTKEDKPELIVWPETATPFYYLYNYQLTKMVNSTIREMNAYFLIGSPSFSREEKQITYYNRAYLIRSDGLKTGHYDKVHLVPFGEYVPLKKLLFFVDKMVEGIGDFSPGEKGSTLKFENCDIGIQICYEIIFPGLSRDMVKNNALMLINITNDAWFGNTGAPHQHFSMAVFRAVENKRAVVRSANTGVSGFIDPTGRIIEKSPLFEKAALTAKIPILQTTTFYTRAGDLFVYFCIFVTLSVILLKKTKGNLL